MISMMAALLRRRGVRGGPIPATPPTVLSIEAVLTHDPFTIPPYGRARCEAVDRLLTQYRLCQTMVAELQQAGWRETRAVREGVDA
jgi:hypothetical protein